MLPGGSSGASTKPKKKLPYVGPTVAPPSAAPKIGGNYSKAAVARAVSPPKPPKPQPIAAQPKPPAVVVPNNKGNLSRPAPPPPVRPGPIQGGGGNAAVQRRAAGGGNAKGGPSKSVPKRPAPVVPGPIAQIPTAPPPPSIEAWLGGDTGYLGEQSSMAEALAQFQAEQATARTSGAASFAQQLRELQQSQTSDEGNMQEDFASRGLVNSGSYADALTQLQQQYLTSQGNLRTQQTEWESGLGSSLADFQAQQQLALQQAQQEAIARRAAQYGL